MSHSHLAINHLLQQVEKHRARRAQRDSRPGWVTHLINHVADFFEPLADVGRVGFDCRLIEDRWHVAMFLGCTELVGGCNDGLTRHANFEINLQHLQSEFSRIDRFLWTALPEAGLPTTDAPGTAMSFLTIEGLVESQPLTLEIYSVPPNDLGPGFHRFPNGDLKTA